MSRPSTSFSTMPTSSPPSFLALLEPKNPPKILVDHYIAFSTPQPRFGHAACVTTPELSRFGDLIIFGGCNPLDESLGDMHILVLAEGSSSQPRWHAVLTSTTPHPSPPHPMLEPSGPPSPRHYHSISCVKTLVFVFGSQPSTISVSHEAGEASSAHSRPSSTTPYSAPIHQQASPSILPAPSSAATRTGSVTGSVAPPPALSPPRPVGTPASSMHQATPGSTMTANVIHRGTGEGKKGEAASPPPPRQWHNACVAGPERRHIVYFGSWSVSSDSQLHVFNTDEMRWIRPRLRGDVIPSLYGTSACIGPSGMELFVFGGSDGIGRSNHVHVLKFEARLHLSKPFSQIVLIFPQPTCLSHRGTQLPLPPVAHSRNPEPTMQHACAGITCGFTFSPVSMAWSQHSMLGSQLPPPLSSASLVLLPAAAARTLSLLPIISSGGGMVIPLRVASTNVAAGSSSASASSGSPRRVRAAAAMRASAASLSQSLGDSGDLDENSLSGDRPGLVSGSSALDQLTATLATMTGGQARGESAATTRTDTPPSEAVVLLFGGEGPGGVTNDAFLLHLLADAPAPAPAPTAGTKRGASATSGTSPARRGNTGNAVTPAALS